MDQRSVEEKVILHDDPWLSNTYCSRTDSPLLHQSKALVYDAVARQSAILGNDNGLPYPVIALAN
jgi:hypothetical protein